MHIKEKHKHLQIKEKLQRCHRYVLVQGVRSAEQTCKFRKKELITMPILYLIACVFSFTAN